MFKHMLAQALMGTGLIQGIDYAVVVHYHDKSIQRVVMVWHGAPHNRPTRDMPMSEVEIDSFDDEDVTHWSVRLRMELGV